MMLFFSLLIAHHLADYYLQRHSWIMCKVQHHEKSRGLFYHILVHLVLTALALYVSLEQWTWHSTLALIFIITTHYAIDIWKTYQTFIARYYIADQMGHFLVILLTVAGFVYFHPDLIISHFTSLPFAESTQITLISWALALLFLGNPTGISFMVFFRPLTQDKNIGIAENDGEFFNNINAGAIARMITVLAVGIGQLFLASLLITLHLILTYYQLRQFANTDTGHQHIARTKFTYTYLVANHALAWALGMMLFTAG